MTNEIIHFQSGPGEVKCGARMGSEWDLGNVTTDWRLVTCSKCRPEFSISRPYRSQTAEYRPEPSPARKRALTVILSVTWDGPSLEDQIADIIADLTARRFHSESIILPPDNDGWVYVGSDYYGTIRKTNMSDRFRFTYDRGMNEPGSGTSRAVSRSHRSSSCPRCGRLYGIHESEHRC